MLRHGLTTTILAGALALGLGACSVPAAEGGWFNGSNGLPTPPTTTSTDTNAPKAFTIAGHVSGPVSGGSSVTHVMAAALAGDGARQIVAAVDAQGAFTVDVDPKRIWILVFVDASRAGRVGSDMIVGIYRTGDLHTLAPMGPGSVDLGAVAFADDGTARGTVADADLLAALGLDAVSAAYLASLDETATRAANPDVDGNGQIDAFEPPVRIEVGGGVKAFHLDLQLQFIMPRALTASAAPLDAAITYAGTGVFASFPSDLFGDGWQSSASVAFDAPVHYVPTTGPAKSAEPGDPIPSVDLTTKTSAGDASVGILTLPGYDLPQGRYRFDVAGAVLTFADVRTRTDAELAAATGFLVPFVQLAPDGGFAYAWKKRTADGWMPASAAELALLATDATLAFSVGGQPYAVTIPGVAPSGSIPWTAEGPLCQAVIRYQDKLGVQYVANVPDVPHACDAP